MYPPCTVLRVMGSTGLGFEFTGPFYKSHRAVTKRVNLINLPGSTRHDSYKPNRTLGSTNWNYKPKTSRLDRPGATYKATFQSWFGAARLMKRVLERQINMLLGMNFKPQRVGTHKFSLLNAYFRIPTRS